MFHPTSTRRIEADGLYLRVKITAKGATLSTKVGGKYRTIASASNGSAMFDGGRLTHST